MGSANGPTKESLSHNHHTLLKDNASINYFLPFVLEIKDKQMRHASNLHQTD